MLHPDPSPGRREAGSAWLLATTAARILREPGERESREVVLNNAYRLLQAYRASADTKLMHFEEPLQGAMDAAFGEAFPGIAPEEAVESLTVSLRDVAYPEGVPVPDLAAAIFFEGIARRLDGRF